MTRRCPSCLGKGQQLIKAINFNKAYYRRCAKCKGTGWVGGPIPWYLRAHLGEELDTEVAQRFRRKLSWVQKCRRKLNLPEPEQQRQTHTLDSCVLEALDRFSTTSFKDLKYALENNYGSCGDRRVFRALRRLEGAGKIVHDTTVGRNHGGYIKSGNNS